MSKYKSEWVKDWDNETVIGNAVSLGMMYLSEKISTENLKYNKKIMIKELEKRQTKTVK